MCTRNHCLLYLSLIVFVCLFVFFFALPFMLFSLFVPLPYVMMGTRTVRRK